MLRERRALVGAFPFMPNPDFRRPVQVSLSRRGAAAIAKKMWEALFDDLRLGRAAEEIAARFHRGLARATAAICAEQAAEASVGEVVLAGGVFQNRLLIDALSHELEQAGLVVLDNAEVPPNDGGLSLGQATIAAVRVTVGRS